jgi:hypothetical protein
MQITTIGLDIAKTIAAPIDRPSSGASISGKCRENPSVGISSFEVAGCYTRSTERMSPGVGT